MPPPTSSTTTPFQSQSLPRLKSSFLTTQIRLLGTQLIHSPPPTDKQQQQQQQQPSSSTTPPPPPPPTIPAATLTKLLEKINKKITAHNRLAYSVESQRHVVEQVDGVYWRDVLQGGVPVEKAETVVGRDVDFVADEDGLPGEWAEVVLRTNRGPVDEGERRGGKRRRVEERDDEDEDGDEDGEQEQEQAERYAVLHARLRAGVQRRTELRAKVARYRKLKGLLEGFGDPKRDVQPNLVTRDNAELEGEMARMRVLLARVGSKIQAGEKSVERVVDEEVGQDQRPADTTKLEAVLGLG